MECCKKIITRIRLIKKLKCAVSLTFLFSACCVYATRNIVGHEASRFYEISCLSTLKTVNDWFESKFQNLEGNGIWGPNDWVRPSVSKPRRLLGGPGSSPPRCNSKCGKCKPCEPVHLPVPPGTPITAEYYPEAWRCKCGSRLYIP
ncbi:EPIDERMAL PATTERNING FACTOR-like protein 6 [Striga hermonthica]|uniref:Epidermal patterning factor-like protein n=1 Tax=Striga hermonthica TaxID=68872 RepID=A0A9N7MWI6_STRHE|nr:EPIDERMAL PATTERNING FACTOR-like protein 6 [Striga hermonthica]